ncbi:glycoside hydrolase/phage tail family protein [Pseudoxanthobacter sp.]|uniref:baseplate multidomain protein megatron n=1 Tax=Pseudoxanthobacter sp. TaxID=1925742 RepID=UPI002FE1BEA0
MATLVLQAAGAAVGGLFGPLGAVIGGAIGAVAGAAADQRLFGGTVRSGPRLDSVAFQGGAEGASLPRIYGRMRLSGTVIWASQFVETASTATSGGKGVSGTTGTTSYSYAANVAVAICEGPVSHIGRIWADGKPLDRASIVVRLYKGDEAQAPDMLPVFYQGAAPAYRGTAYAVFQNLPLADYGNRLPQFSFEVIRAVDRLEPMVRAVTLIPGATEFGYSPTPVLSTGRFGDGAVLNRHVASDYSDLEASLDELTALCPNLERVALVAGWFGTDLRAGQCRLKPKVEARTRATLWANWQVSGLPRAGADLVSDTAGALNYGGTPSDDTVMAAIAAIRNRGLKVTFYPFILMDVPAGNGLPDPYGGSEQAAFPWRGRITVHPAPGLAGSPDGTAATAAAVAAFVGTAQPAHFGTGGAVPAYSGPEEWSLRRMVLHYATLAAMAGGVDAFIVASEMRGLSQVRSSRTTFPFVDALVGLAADVRAILGAGPVVTYAADWSEFSAYSPPDGSGDVIFHLDALWASPAVTAIGIDAYWPLADWRDGSHADAGVARSTCDVGYLKGNVAGGEGFDWYYASAADRAAGTRTPITDGAYGKPWVFRYKDIAGWWANPHVNRLGGTESTQTGWSPGSKPVWLTEVGCPAIDRGANQPNVFVDPKSSESAFPYFSNGARDDAIQRRYLEALIGHFDPAADGFAAADNPVHPVTGIRMVAPDAVHVWTWDARPWPAFPALTDVWSDGPNWERGHWLTGRLGAVTLDGLIRAIAADYDIATLDVGDMAGVIDGYLIDSPMSLRDAVQPLADGFRLSLADGGGRILVRDLDRAPVATITDDDLVDSGEGGSAALTLSRTQDMELPAEVRLTYLDSAHDLQAATAAARRLTPTSRGVARVDLAAAMQESVARRAVDLRLHDEWAARETMTLHVAPALIALEPGDVVQVQAGGLNREAMIEEIEDAEARTLKARALDRRLLRGGPQAAGNWQTTRTQVRTPPAAEVLDLPQLSGSIDAQRPFMAVAASPWLGSLVVMRAFGSGTLSQVAVIDRPAVMGALVADTGPGFSGRWDRGTRIVLQTSGALSSLGEDEVLAGGNALAIRAANGLFEVVQFATATLTGTNTYELSGLLRGQLGTDEAMAAGLPAGALAVLLDERLAALPLERAEIGLGFDYRVFSPAVTLDDPSVTALSAATAGRGLRPFSPVHLRARRLEGGDIALSWVRRTRSGGDDWGAGDVALGEESEAYRVDILNGGLVVRSLEVSAPAALYSAAAQAADFGGLPDALTFTVAQIGTGYGPGSPAKETVNV